MLEFLRLFRWLFALISVFVAIPLLCANYFINTRTEYGSTSLTVNAGNNGTASSGLQLNNMTSVIGDLQLYTAANIKGDGLWVHVMADFAVTLLVVLQGECPLHLGWCRIRAVRRRSALMGSPDIRSAARSSYRAVVRHVSYPLPLPLFPWPLALHLQCLPRRKLLIHV